MSKSITARKPWQFQPNNKLGAGNSGRHHPSQITQELISQLNEIDKHTSKAKKHKLCEQLIKLALGYDYKIKRALDDGTVISETVTVQPDIVAIKEIFDRVEGKARQQLAVTGADDGPVQFEDVTNARMKLGKLIELRVIGETNEDEAGLVQADKKEPMGKPASDRP